MAKAEAAQESNVKGGLTILGLIILSVVAIVGGLIFGSLVPGMLAPTPTPVAHETPEEGAEDGATTDLIPLQPITTNLAEPATTWVRLEAVLTVEKSLGADAELLKREMAEDILGYLRTVSLTQLSEPSGFQHLREDLSDRVRVRSRGLVSGVIITSLILE